MSNFKWSLVGILIAIVGLPVNLNVASTPTYHELYEEFHLTCELRLDGRVSLQNTTGAIRIKSWDRNEVRIDAIKRAYKRELLADAEIKVESDPKVIRIRTQYNSPTTTWDFGSEKRYNNPASIDYVVMVPRNARLDTVEIINGSIEVSDVSGYIDASSVNGWIKTHGSMGEMRLSTVNGRIEADLAGLRELKPVTITSVNGEIVLRVSPVANGELYATTMKGQLDDDFGFSVQQDASVEHKLIKMLGTGGAAVKLNNINGNIIIRGGREGSSIKRMFSDKT